MKEIIIEHLNKVKEIIDSKTVYSFSFNLLDLPDHNNFQLNIRKQPKFEKLFKDLDGKLTFCLYWFECADIY